MRRGLATGKNKKKRRHERLMRVCDIPITTSPFFPCYTLNGDIACQKSGLLKRASCDALSEYCCRRGLLNKTEMGASLLCDQLGLSVSGVSEFSRA